MDTAFHYAGLVALFTIGIYLLLRLRKDWRTLEDTSKLMMRSTRVVFALIIPIVLVVVNAYATIEQLIAISPLVFAVWGKVFVWFELRRFSRLVARSEGRQDELIKSALRRRQLAAHLAAKNAKASSSPEEATEP